MNNEAGILSLSWLKDKSRKPKESLPKDAGICPFNLLWPKPKPARLCRLPNEAGILLVNALLLTSKVSRAERFPSDAGKAPDKWLVFKLRICREDRFASEPGILPVSSLSCKSNTWIMEQFSSLQQAQRLLKHWSLSEDLWWKTGSPAKPG